VGDEKPLFYLGPWKEKKKGDLCIVVGKRGGKKKKEAQPARLNPDILIRSNLGGEGEKGGGGNGRHTL